MFTGIIEKIGKVSHVTEKNISQVIGIRIDDFNSALGDSICINGVCLTVEDIDEDLIIMYIHSVFHQRLIIYQILKI